ncbi:MAG: alkene reductase, partial [Proteobacteria bacterium]
MKSRLLEPLKLGDLTVPNRIIMAPLTRSRAGASRVPNEMMREYYEQRSGAGLILSEATSIEPMGAE